MTPEDLLAEVQRLKIDLARERRLTDVLPEIERNALTSERDALRQDVANLREKIASAKWELHILRGKCNGGTFGSVVLGSVDEVLRRLG